MNYSGLVNEDLFLCEIVADLEAEMAALRTTTSNLNSKSLRMCDEQVEFKNEADQRERELRRHIECLERKDYVISSLLELMVKRTTLLQDQLYKADYSNAPKTESEDELSNLRQLIEKEREKSKILEDQLKSGASDIPRPVLSENERARLKEIDVLKAQVGDRYSNIQIC